MPVTAKCEACGKEALMTITPHSEMSKAAGVAVPCWMPPDGWFAAFDEGKECGSVCCSRACAASDSKNSGAEMEDGGNVTMDANRGTLKRFRHPQEVH